jgi:hypothetical protein
MNAHMNIAKYTAKSKAADPGALAKERSINAAAFENDRQHRAELAKLLYRAPYLQTHHQVFQRY